MQHLHKTSLALLFSFFVVLATGQNRPIGVFDSGTGGLTVLEALLKLDAFNNSTGKPGSDGIPDFKGEYFNYLADQANMPYGNYAAEGKTDFLKEQILRCMTFLARDSYFQKKEADQFVNYPKTQAKMLVVACNTATAYALTDIKQLMGSAVPVVGVIDAGCKAALNYQLKERGTVGVFATVGTVASNGYPRALKKLGAEKGLTDLSIVSQGGYGLAESIDRDWSFLADQVSKPRTDYKGPSLKNANYPIDTGLARVYQFVTTGNSLLCEYDDQGRCTEMQLNDPVNYVRYHLVTLLEKMKNEHYQQPLNTLILGCTHYPYLKDTIAVVLRSLYDLKEGDTYRYRTVLSSRVELVDPAIETAKEAFVALQALKQSENKSPTSMTTAPQKDAFFIAVPNTRLTEIQLQSDGWFTYAYKYGRKAGSGNQYVQFVPFDKNNISSATYQRFQRVLPASYQRMSQAGVAGAQIR
jgi:glutamate racemase